MYPPVALNQYTLVNRTHKHYIYMLQGLTNILKSHQSSTICKQGNQRWQTSPAAPPGGLGHVTRECACQISWWSVEKWRRYYILKFRGNTFRWPMTLTFDLKFWKYLSVTVYPYVICMPSFIMIGWEMAEILHFEILRKHGQTHTHTHTHKQTNKQTDMGITIPRPPPIDVSSIWQHWELGQARARGCRAKHCHTATHTQCVQIADHGFSLLFTLCHKYVAPNRNITYLILLHVTYIYQNYHSQNIKRQNCVNVTLCENELRFCGFMYSKPLPRRLYTVVTGPLSVIKDH